MARTTSMMIAISGAVAMGCAPGDELSVESDNLTAYPTTNAIQDPPQFAWTFQAASGGTPVYFSGTLELGQATFTIGGQTEQD